MAFRDIRGLTLEAMPPLFGGRTRGAASHFYSIANGKAKPYRNVRRQSRDSSEQ
jgi:hypothetical protein